MKHEKEFKIPIAGTNKNIYAKQYGSLEQPVVVFVHGLTGHMDEQIFYNGARYFHERGISSLRFNLYDWSQDARKLTECTLTIHSHDLNVVTDYLRKQGAKRIFVVGHSYGGPTILLADSKKFNAVVLWDPSHGDVFDEEDEVKYVKELDGYYVIWGAGFIIGSKMRNLEKELKWDTLTAQITTPLKVISAGKGVLVKQGKKYVELAQGPKEHAVIAQAEHNFNEEGVAEQLFDETISWFKKYI